MNHELVTNAKQTPSAGDAETVVPEPVSVGMSGTVPQALLPMAPISTLPANFELIGWVAEGGQGVIYKARQLKPQRTVAIKMIRSGECTTETQVKAFLDEANKQARLDHQGILAIYECGTHNDRPYIAMEFCAGGTLGDAFHNKPVPWKTAARLIAYVARVLNKAHSNGVIHRDLKPANLLLKEPIPGMEALATEHLRIADFGLAIDKNAELLRKSTQQAGGTTGTFAGTALYMAPEQADDSRKVGPSADIYSLGVILYEMLTGVVPINAPSLGEFIGRLKTDLPIPPRRLASRCPRDLEAICMKCLKKDPKARYATAEQLAEDLEAVLVDNPLVYARPVGWVERAVMWGWRNKALSLSLSVAVFALIAGTIVSTSLYLALQSEIRKLAYMTVKSLKDETTELRMVPALAEKVKENSGQPLLMQALDENPAHINLQLAAVLCGNSTFINTLVDRIHLVKPAELKVIAENLKDLGLQEIISQTRMTVRNESIPGSQRLRNYGFLAICDQKNDIWKDRSQDIVDLLIGQDLVDIGDWAELFKPIGKHLVKAFLNVLDNEIQASNKTDDVDRPRLAAEYLHHFTDGNADEKALFAISVPSELVPWLKRKAIFTTDVDALKAALRKMGADKSKSERLRAHAAAQLAMMDDWEPALAKLGFAPDPTGRTWLINRLIVLKPEIDTLMRQYDVHEPSRAISNCAILDVLHELAPQVKGDEDLNHEWHKVAELLIKEWRDNPHPGVHAGAERLLRKMNKYIESKGEIGEPASEGNAGSVKSATNAWRVNSRGITMVQIARGQKYQSGSPEKEKGRIGHLEYQNVCTIDYPFEIGAKEVGENEFFDLIPRASHKHRKEWFADHDSSINDISFHDAARFCNELSRIEKIPENQWCYEIDASTAKAILKPHFLALQGYRLPTEVEWECVCRAGTTSAFYCGNVWEHLADYANYSWSRKDKMMPRGSYRPNFLGMFDMHGNVMEWAHGSISTKSSPKGEGVFPARVDAVLRGGPWHNGPAWCRSAARNEGVLTNKGFSTGFRVARTLASTMGNPK